MSLRLSSPLFIFLACLPMFAQEPLTVAAASDLSSLGPEMQKLYAQQSGAVELRFVFSASGILRQQIESGAPFDVFLSANADYVDALAKAGKLSPQSVMTYGNGRVGVLWRDGKKHPLRELTTPVVRLVALPNPKLAPYGVAAQQALEYGGLWSMLQAKIVYAENVRQALQIVESGNADAVLTADSLLQGRENVEVIPADWHKPVIQKAGIVSSSNQQAVAARFLKFLASEPAQALLARYGFDRP